MDVLSRTKKTSTDCHRFTSLWSLLLLASVGSTAAAEQPVDAQNRSDASAPYIVFVAEPSAFARCGPGKEHYRTESLRRGQELEVYVESGDGWLGIRPLANSFCWMPADAIEPSDDEKTGTVREDKTVAWIGTNLGQARRYRWQVQLDAGESVSIIGKTEREGSGGSKTWLRIVPPSGEFRWIHRDQVAESAEQLAERVAKSESDSSEPNDSETVKTVANLSATTEEPPGDSLQQAATLVPIKDRVTDQSESITASTNAASTNAASTNAAATRTAANGLREANTIPTLRPAPSQPTSLPNQVADKPIQFHRGKDPEAFEDRGAVIGSGLKATWREDSDGQNADVALASGDDSSILSVERLDHPADIESASSGAAAAADAIASPIRKITDVVANFISPPRLVEIDSSSANAFDSLSPADRRWLVGSGRTGDPSANLSAPASLAATRPVPNSMATGDGTQSRILQTGAISDPSITNAYQTNGPSGRVITVSQIARVEDAVAQADIETIGHVLSQLMAEGASADEIDPLIRRADVLLRSGDVNFATRTRDLLDRAQRYRNVAARRDGVTTIRPSSHAIDSDPIPGMQDHGNTDRGGARQNTAADPSLRQATSQTPLASPPASQTSPRTIESPLGPVAGGATGYLVQVYSSRPNSPPFALTDDAGLTVAYVTPYPGVNLRNHLNSRISVTGHEKLLEGMSTPHILADRAIRR